MPSFRRHRDYKTSSFVISACSLNIGIVYIDVQLWLEPYYLHIRVYIFLFLPDLTFTQFIGILYIEYALNPAPNAIVLKENHLFCFCHDSGVKNEMIDTNLSKNVECF